MKDLAPELEARLRELLRRALSADVHAARVAIKKARAALRVLRPALGKDAFERRNDALRRAARALSMMRDAEMLAETAKELAHASERAAARELSRRARRADSRHGELTRARRLLAAQLRERPCRGLSPEDFARAVQADYKRAKKRLRLALLSRTDESFHAWRRAAKALRFELALLESLPAPLENQARALKDLGWELGRDHDAAVLAETLAREPLTFGEPENVERLVGRARRAQESSRARALRLARRAFGPRPKAVARRLRRALLTSL